MNRGREYDYKDFHFVFVPIVTKDLKNKTIVYVYDKDTQKFLVDYVVDESEFSLLTANDDELYMENVVKKLK